MLLMKIGLSFLFAGIVFTGCLMVHASPRIECALKCGAALTFVGMAAIAVQMFILVWTM